MNQTETRISVDQLRVGLYIRLDNWMAHPFLFSSLKIRNEKQLQALRASGIREVIYCPAESDVEPLPPAVEGAPAAPPVPEEPSPELEAMWQEKLLRREKVAARRAVLVRCEQRFAQSVESVRGLMRNLFARPQESVEQAQVMIGEMVDSLLAEKEAVLHLMSSKGGDENAFYHALNVTVLSLLLGKEAGLDAERMRDLGMGALLHDLGKERVPSQILLKREPWTAAEQNFYRQHVAYGVELAQKLPDLRPGVLEVIAGHHEMLDGSGFPVRLKGGGIGLLARIAAIANAYDNCCNRVNVADSMAPAEALAHMYKTQLAKFDPVLLKRFIRCLGVYPPGSIVQLSNTAIGMVTSVNPAHILQPTLMLYDRAVPKEEAIFFDLEEEPDLSVVRTLRPGDLAREVYEYLDPRTRVSYFAEQGSDRKK